ncbi:hypothetical protein ACFFLS_20845 [Flavobacterium procerum]|uniref:HNH nuclease domain-containing protein n=1 Tax=Flavobacterium procerum TaxID=1455569 RepID=A0ABV6BVN5_9FLAO
MIFVEKGPAPACLLVPDNVWHKETKSAINHYKHTNQTKNFNFTKYRSPEIKNALKAVFGRKCAYCESDYAKVSDGDVEHFRPKGRVEGKKPETPGYYWLANDWDNLLISCQHCNQSRKNKTVDDQGQVLENDNISRGKLDQFPLRNPRKRVTSTRQRLDKEEPYRLLLNPCVDKPEEHFEYDEKYALIKGISDMGLKSIDVYVLQRRDLVKSRSDKLVILLVYIGMAQKALERYNAEKDPFALEIFKENYNAMSALTNKGSEYSGMCRFFVKRFLEDNGLTRTTAEEIFEKPA